MHPTARAKVLDDLKLAAGALKDAQDIITKADHLKADEIMAVVNIRKALSVIDSANLLFRMAQ